MTSNKEWFDKKFGEGSYDGLVSDIEADLKAFPWEDYDSNESEESSVDVRLRVHEGNIYYAFGDIQFDTDHRGRWAYGSLEKDSTAEDVVDYLVGGLQLEFADIDIPATEKVLNGKPYVVYIRNSDGFPELDVSTVEQWNKEDNEYLDDDGDYVSEEDPRIAPQFHIAEPRTPLEDALKAYRKYLEDEGLSYLLEN